MRTMDRSLAKFSSQDEARQATRLYYRQLSPTQRLNLLLDLIDSARKENDASSQGFERVYRVVKLLER
jgi:hypothetical protein